MKLALSATLQSGHLHPTLEKYIVKAYAQTYANEVQVLEVELERHARLFRNGRNQAIRIPREFELEGEEVIIRKEGGRLIIEAVPEKVGLLALLASWEPLVEELPDVDKALLPLDDIGL